MVRSPIIKLPEKILIHTIPNISSGKCKPYVEIVRGSDFELIWTNKESMHLKSYKARSKSDYNFGMSAISESMTIEIPVSLSVGGDIYFRLKHRGGMKNKLICRFAVNTSFVTDNLVTFTKELVDPDKVAKDSRFPDDFKIEVFFRDLCTLCKSDHRVEKFCKGCQSRIDEEELENWFKIQEILDSHDFPSHESGVLLNYNSTQCDYKLILSKYLRNSDFLEQEATINVSEYENSMCWKRFDSETD